MFYRKARIRKRPRTTEVSMEKLGAPRRNAHRELANAVPLSSGCEADCAVPSIISKREISQVREIGRDLIDLKKGFRQ